MIYRLRMEVPDDGNLEGIAQELEAAAHQVRRMSSTSAAHHMSRTDGHFGTSHGVEGDSATDRLLRFVEEAATHEVDRGELVNPHNMAARIRGAVLEGVV